MLTFQGLCSKLYVYSRSLISAVVLFPEFPQILKLKLMDLGHLPNSEPSTRAVFQCGLEAFLRSVEAIHDHLWSMWASEWPEELYEVMYGFQ